MRTLVIFRRPEIWVLLTVIASLAVFAFRSDEVPEVAGPETPEPIQVLPKKKLVVAEGMPESEKSDLAIENVEVHSNRQDGVQQGSDQQGGAQQGWVVDLTLLGRSISDSEAPVTEETLTARTGAGDPVPHFFEPFKEEQSLLPDEDSLVTVRLWLEKPADSISLDFQGRTVKTELPR